MTVRDLIKTALDNTQPEGIQLAAARKVSDFCRGIGMDYYATFELVHEVDPMITMPQWDGLMYECDREESQG